MIAIAINGTVFSTMDGNTTPVTVVIYDYLTPAQLHQLIRDRISSCFCLVTNTDRDTLEIADTIFHNLSLMGVK